MKTKSIAMMFVAMALFLNSQLNGQSRATELEYLINAKGSSAELDLENKGYIHMKTDKSYYDIYSYWWNPASRKCVTTRIADGRVQSVVNAPAVDCNQRPANAVADHSYHTASYNQHQAHNHQSNNYQHYDSAAHDAAYERGFRDGMYNNPYHNVYSVTDQINAYSTGYGEGVAQRNNNSSYHSGQGGYATHVDANDLLHKSEAHAYTEMQRRGFAEVRKYRDDGKDFAAWYNTSTRQCVKTVAKNGSIIYVKMNSAQCN